MKRILSVWFPAWPIDRMRRADPFAVPDDRPFALVMSGARGIIITAVNARARAEGIKAGDTLSDARAALPHLLTRRAEPDKDAAALLDLVRWSGRYGPARNVDGEDGLWIDVTGVAHLFGGEALLMSELFNRLRAFGLTARGGLADSAAAAYALARFRAQEKESQRVPSVRREFAIAPAGEMRCALAALPVEALRLEDAAVLLLKRLGLRRIGQLYDLPRSALARRFQSLSPARTSARKVKGISKMVGSVLARLDLALGSDPEANRPFLESPRQIVRRVLAEPLISADAIEATVGELAASLCDGLDKAAAGARRIRLSFYRVDGTVAEVQAGTAKPCREPGHLEHLLKERLSAIDAGFGIDLVTLEATRVEPLAPMQTVLTAPLEGGAHSDTAFLIDRLANRLGEQVFRLSDFESHIPERAQFRISPLAKRAIPSQVTGRASTRPPLLLSAPEPIAVLAEVPEGAPIQFRWRRVNHRVAKAVGPERIEPEWWGTLRQRSSDDEDAGTPPRPRDYYRLEDDRGARFWVFRDGLYSREAEEGAPLWYMHGLFG